MKYYEQLAKKNLFTFSDIISITKTETKALYVIKKYIEKGYIKKIKKNYYGAIDLSFGGLRASRYEIGTFVNANSFISHHGVFEYYGYMNQVYNALDVSSLQVQHDFTCEGNHYIFHKTKSLEQVYFVNGIRISSIERAIVDCINDSKNYEFGEIIQNMHMIKSINVEKILKYLEILNKKLLYKKVGCFLEEFETEFEINKEFFAVCLTKGGNSRGYYDTSKKGSLVYNKKWKFYMHKQNKEGLYV